MLGVSKRLASAVDMEAVRQRGLVVLEEPLERKPYDLFYFEIDRFPFFGRKSEVELDRDGTPVRLKCSLVTGSMVLGVVERHMLTDRGVAVFYRPLTDSEKHAVFELLANDCLIDLYYPWPGLDKGTKREKCTPAHEWTPEPEFVAELSIGEQMMREQSIDLLSHCDLRGGAVAYDPACSTGEFLQSLKSRFPRLYTIGQDISRPMLEYARPRMDEAHLGDSIEPAIPAGSADFVFLRFLNFNVVSTVRAYELCAKIVTRCKPGGLMVVFGYTPVLIAAAWFELSGLTTLRRTAFTKKYNAVFQYYVLRVDRQDLKLTPPFRP